MFGACPVVRVSHDNEDGFVEINESDFDSETHTIFYAGQKEPVVIDDTQPKRRGRKPASVD